MVAKKKLTKKRRTKGSVPAEPDRIVVMPSSVVKFVQIAAAGDGLYALDEDGRVFVHIDHGWMQIDGDEARCTRLPPLPKGNGRVVEEKSLTQRIL